VEAAIAGPRPQRPSSGTLGGSGSARADSGDDRMTMANTGTKRSASTRALTELIQRATERARRQTQDTPEPELTSAVRWPVHCTVGPGLEGAIACESKVGYVNGSKGRLIYRGYDIFDLCAHSTFEEVSYLLLHGSLPTAEELAAFNERLVRYRRIPKTLRLLMGFPVEEMSPMAALRIGTNMMRQEFTYVDKYTARPGPQTAISADEDSIPMETKPRGERHAIYEFHKRRARPPRRQRAARLETAAEMGSCYHLIAGLATIAAAVSRIRRGLMPMPPREDLSHAGNYLYMVTGKEPTPTAERIMDVALILHADHGMNASTFATMVVASTLSDIYFSVGAGIAALNGPLHGGANEQVLATLKEIGSVENVGPWYAQARAAKRLIMGFGHRVYKTFDPRARVLQPLVRELSKGSARGALLNRIATALEREVIRTLGREKGIYPNVDFYSGGVYSALGLPADLFTPTFAVARVSGWTARVMEYLRHNRIFRPRAIYTGPMGLPYVPLARRG